MEMDVGIQMNLYPNPPYRNHCKRSTTQKL